MNSKFIPIQQHENALKIMQNLDFQMMILLGKSGSGKSFLLQQLAKNHKTFLFSQPFLNEENFLNAFGEKFLNKVNSSFEDLVLFAKNGKEKFLILLDEVGMYSQDLLEKVRILSDFGTFQFVLSTHKNHTIFTKEHFASRVAKTIILKALSRDELYFYIDKKFNIQTPFSVKEIKFLQKISLNNLRIIDQILHTYNAIFAHYKERHIQKQAQFLLELCAIHHNLRL